MIVMLISLENYLKSNPLSPSWEMIVNRGVEKMKQIISIIIILLFANASDNFYYQNDKKTELIPIKNTEKLQKKDSNQTINYYKTEQGQIVGVTQEIIIKVEDKKSLEPLLKKYNLNLKQNLTTKLYVVETNSTQETLEITNSLYAEENVSYSHPNFIKRIDKR